jgi:hypothetical protein
MMGLDEDIQFELNAALEFGDTDRAERIQRVKDHLTRTTSALRNIAEGNLGDAPWQANYEAIRAVARSALASVAPSGAEPTQAVPAEDVASLTRERDEARSIVRDIHWMAVRYADNRKSYAVGMCNDALRKAYDAGWLKYTGGNNKLDPQYARDGMFDREWVSALDAANARATASEAEATSLRRKLEKHRTALAEARERINRYADTAAEHDLVARIDALRGASE